MAEDRRYIWSIPQISTMKDEDRFLVVVGTREYLISKSDLSKILNGLSSNEKDKLKQIIIDGDGTRVLNNQGGYSKISEFLSNEQFKVNDKGVLEINAYHKHTNQEVLDKFNTDENQTLIYDGQALNGYILPEASQEILGGVKVDGDTIKINDGVISADVIGNWSADTTYPVGYFVVYNNSFYECISAHIASASFDTSKWELIGGSSNSGEGIKNWAPSVAYSVGDIVLNDTTLYKCINNHISNNTFDTSESAKWTVLTGAKGDKGDTGATGLNGKDGTNGKSTYEIACDNGFIGSESDWLESLRGQDGITIIKTNKIDKTFTLSVDNWTDTVPYTQTVQLSGITPELNPIIDVIVSDSVEIGLEEQKSFSDITRVITGNGEITAYCYKNKPAVDLNVMVGVI